MNMALMILGFAGIAALEVPTMVRDKRWRDLIVYSVIFLLVLALGTAIALGVKVPSPIKAAQALYEYLGLSFQMPG